MRTFQRAQIVISLIIIAIMVFVLAGVFYELYRPRLLKNTETLYYIVKPGSTAQRVAYDLNRLGLTKHPKLLIFIIALEGRVDQLQSGEYELPPGISLQDVINKMTSGDIAKHELTLVDGWTFNQVLLLLQQNPHLQHTLTGKSPAQIAALLQLPYPNPEGLFLPETYQFNWPSSDLDILRRAHQAMMTVLDAEWKTRAANLHYASPYEALIVASLIQKESGNKQELTKISGVINRRLQKGMRLQIDPTVIYALGVRYQGKLHHRDLKVDSPYNTYRYKGLPPTPIALPCFAAIDAALHPDGSDALYFVAKGDGSHYFSSTLSEHDRAVLKYLLTARPINDKMSKTS